MPTPRRNGAAESSLCELSGEKWRYQICVGSCPSQRQLRSQGVSVLTHTHRTPSAIAQWVTPRCVHATLATLQPLDTRGLSRAGLPSWPLARLNHRECPKGCLRPCLAKPHLQCCAPCLLDKALLAYTSSFWNATSQKPSSHCSPSCCSPWNTHINHAGDKVLN